jgi:hypothetical protein
MRRSVVGSSLSGRRHGIVAPACLADVRFHGQVALSTARRTPLRVPRASLAAIVDLFGLVGDVHRFGHNDADDLVLMTAGSVRPAASSWQRTVRLPRQRTDLPMLSVRPGWANELTPEQFAA